MKAILSKLTKEEMYLMLRRKEASGILASERVVANMERNVIANSSKLVLPVLRVRRESVR